MTRALRRLLAELAFLIVLAAAVTGLAALLQLAVYGHVRLW